MWAALAIGLGGTLAWLVSGLTVAWLAHRLTQNQPPTNRERTMITNLRPLIEPRVNLNGTSKDELVRQYTKVMRKLSDTLGLMGEAMPHGRDFQTMNNPEFHAEQARKAWRERMTIIRELRDEIAYFAISINDQ